MRRKHKYHRDEKRQIGAILDFKEIEPMKMNSEQLARREPEGFRNRVFSRNDLILEDYYYLDHLLTHSAAVRAETWQAIETAPKDGTQVLLWWPHWAMRPVVGWYSRISDGWSSNASLSEGPEPTHWMPLPSPPTS